MKQNMFAALLFAMLTGMQTEPPPDSPPEKIQMPEQEQTETAEPVRT